MPRIMMLQQGQVIAEPADLKPEFPLARQTGYLFADAPSSYTPPAELVTFLEAKTKPLYIGAWDKTRDPLDRS
jgi:hypothetical protein